MPARFVCLANSFKEGGRCLAGIELDNNNNPKIENGIQNGYDQFATLLTVKLIPIW
jgi:hypothetical protein